MGVKTNKQLHAKLKKRKGKRVPKSTISDHTAKLKKLGLITAQILYNLREFYLTNRGKLTISEIMARGEGLNLGLPVRGHAFGFICRIVRAPKDLWDRVVEGNWVAFYPKNRVVFKSKPKIMGCMVIFNPRSVQFMPPEVYGPSAESAFEQALRLVLKVKDFLENEDFPGLVLGTPEQIAKVTGQHYARPFDPLAVEYYKNSLKTGARTTYRSDRLGIDLSIGVPEGETVHRVFAKDDLAKITDFYERLIRSEVTFDDLEGIKRQMPKHFGKIMERIDSLDKGLISQDKILSHLASSLIVLTGSQEKLAEEFGATNRLLVTLLRRRRRRRSRPKPKKKTRWEKFRGLFH